MPLFMLNPPRAKRRVNHRKRKVTARRKLRKNPVKKSKTTSKSASSWRKLVKRYGVMGAVNKRKAGKRAAAKRKRTVKRKTTKRATKRGKVNPMAKSRKRRRTKRRRTYASNPKRTVRRRKRRRSYAKNPAPKRRRRRRARRNPWYGQKKKHASAARKGWRTRKAKKSRRGVRRRTRRKSYYSARRYTRRRGKVRGSRKQVSARRKNIHKALNKRYGARRWTKHSSAKWNPGTALSIGGFSRAMTQTFSVEMLKDGLAIAGGIVGAMALPSVLQNILPRAITSRVSLTTGWSGYIANFASAGIVGYLTSLALGNAIGRKVLYGGLGASMAKLLLDKIPGLSAKTGVTLGGNSELDRLIEEEIASELATGSDMGAFLTPGQSVGAEGLGDYVSPGGVASSAALGMYNSGVEFGDYEPATGVEF